MTSDHIETDGDRYIVEIPKSEVSHGAVSPGETYRVGLLSQVDASASATAQPQTPEQDTDPERANTAPATASRRRRSPKRDHRIAGRPGRRHRQGGRGYVVIVPDDEPGDSPTVEIETVQENVAFARSSTTTATRPAVSSLFGGS